MYFNSQITEIRLIGLDLLKSLLCDSRSAELFSKVADEANYVSCKEQMVVCIRWVDEYFMVHGDPVEIIHLLRTDASTLTSALKDSLLRLCLQLGQWQAQAYDGASNMSDYIMLCTVITVAATTNCLSEYATDPMHSNYHASHSVQVQRTLPH